MQMLLLAASVLALTECSPEPQPAHGASSQTTASSAVPQLPKRYWDARKELIARGYKPAPTSAGFTVCVAEMEKGQYLDGACAREETLPEISSCAGSGTSPCLAFWRGPDDRLLKIVTTGEPQPAVIDGSAWATEAE